MSAQDNMTIVRQCYDLFNKNQLDRAAQYADPNAVWEMVPTHEIYRGPSGFEECLREFKRGYPDMKVEVKNLIGTDNAVVCEIHCTGTNTGILRTPQGDHPPTNKKIDSQIVDVWELRNGKVTRIRSYFDTGIMMQQLGIAA